MPRVSVIMASYNHAAFVEEAMASVFTQSYRDLELVVTDDGSGDGTPEVIRRCRDPRLRFHAFPENRGACAALNDTIARATGEYAAVLNSDDFFLPGKLEKQVAFLDAHPEVGAVFGLPKFVDEHSRPFFNPAHAFDGIFSSTNRSRWEWLNLFFRSGNCLCHPTIMVRKSCYDRVGMLDPLLMQLPDLDLWVRLCRAFAIHVAPEQVTGMRVLERERNTSAPSPERLARCAWEMETILGHYAGLGEADLRAVFPHWPAAAGRPARVMLALEALAVPVPGYAQFGLRLLQQCLREDPASFTCREYFALVGRHDPFGAQLQGREFQWLKKSRFVRVARRLVRWWRTRNFRG